MKNFFKTLFNIFAYSILGLNMFIASAGSVFGTDAHESNKKFLFAGFILIVFMLRKSLLKIIHSF